MPTLGHSPIDDDGGICRCDKHRELRRAADARYRQRSKQHIRVRMHNRVLTALPVEARRIPIEQRIAWGDTDEQIADTLGCTVGEAAAVRRYLDELVGEYG